MLTVSQSIKPIERSSDAGIEISQSSKENPRNSIDNFN
jgi:hypothetical protein